MGDILQRKAERDFRISVKENRVIFEHICYDFNLSLTEKAQGEQQTNTGSLTGLNPLNF